jgi:high-affinity Fe2+/Pb2+ permease
MTPNQRSSSPWSVFGAGAVAVAACAVCCIGPVLAVLGGIGAASAIGAAWIPALAVVAVVALVGVVWVLRRRRAAACKTGQGVVDLGMPTPASTDDETRPMVRN